MGAGSDGAGKMTVSSSGGGSGCLLRLLGAAAVVLIMLVATSFFAVKTEGARDFIEGRIEHFLGTDAQIGRTRIGLFPYELVVEDVITRGGEGDVAPLVTIQELRVGPALKSRWRLALHRINVRLVRGSDEAWRPGALRRLGDLPGRSVEEISRLTFGFRSKTSLQVSDGTVEWVAADGTRSAAARGVSLLVAPVSLPGGAKTYYHELAVYETLDGDGNRVTDIQRAWLSGDEDQYVELSRAGGGEPLVSETGFWGRSR
jgi:hypothetical protein